MNIADIMWQTMESHVKEIVKNVCDTYKKDPKYKILEIIEHNELKGFAVYHDDNDIRYIHEVHYIGKNKFVALKFWKWFKKGITKMRAVVQKSNTKMFDLYKRIGFSVVSEDNFNIYLKRGD
jgi:hypothetical protein